MFDTKVSTEHIYHLEDRELTYSKQQVSIWLSITVYKTTNKHNVTSELPCPLPFIKQQVNFHVHYSL